MFKKGLSRILIYGLVVVLLAEFLLYDTVNEFNGLKFSEYSITEYLQSIVLAISSVLLFIIYKKYQSYKYTSLLMFGFLTSSFIREQDVFFEQFLGYKTWQIAVLLVLLFVFYHIFKNFKTVKKEINQYVDSLSFGVFLTGSLTTYVFSRLFGRKKFWNAVMGENFDRSVKNAAEECLELYGYVIVLFAVIELFILVINTEKQQSLSIKTND